MNKKMNSNVLLVAVISAVVFIAYNVLVFAIGGFSDHTAVFWTSYVFMLIASVIVTVTGFMLRNTVVEPGDWIMNYPFYKHGIVYIVIELVLSVIFMLLEDNDIWMVAFVVQFLVLCVFAVLILSCFMAKNVIEGVGEKVAVKTSFMKTLRVDVEMLAEKAKGSQEREVFVKLAEAVRYSDPVSNSALEELEQSIAQEINDAKMFVACSDFASAVNCCNRASVLLLERNKKTKMLK